MSPECGHAKIDICYFVENIITNVIFSKTLELKICYVKSMIAALKGCASVYGECSAMLHQTFSKQSLLGLIHSLCTGNISWICSQIWHGKKKHQQITKTAQLYLLIFYTCTNKGHMKICYFLKNSQYKITIVQIQMSEN